MFMLFFSFAFAEETPPNISATLNPKQLLNAFAECSVEYALKPTVGIGGLLGFGKTDSFQYDLGIHARYYPLGSFSGGLAVGGQFVYYNLIHRNNHDNVNGHILYPSLFVGGKYIFDIGFTIDSQLGLTYKTAIIRDQERSSPIINTEWALLYSINVGWSF
jgi:hypothetical protein